jgi:hypothetical protein
MTSCSLCNKRKCVFTIKNSQVKANRFECQIPLAVTADTRFLPVHTHTSAYWRLVFLNYLVYIFVSHCQRSSVLQYYVYCTCARFSYYFVSGKPGVSAELDQVSSILQPCSKRRTVKTWQFKFLCRDSVCLHCCLTEYGWLPGHQRHILFWIYGSLGWGCKKHFLCPILRVNV